jgi:hypothetical protein
MSEIDPDEIQEEFEIVGIYQVSSVVGQWRGSQSAEADGVKICSNAERGRCGANRTVQPAREFKSENGAICKTCNTCRARKRKWHRKRRPTKPKLPPAQHAKRGAAAGYLMDFRAAEFCLNCPCAECVYMPDGPKKPDGKPDWAQCPIPVHMRYY